MKPSDYIEVINEVERRFPVDEWTVEGVRIWPLIRIELSTKLHWLNNEVQPNPDALDKKPRYTILKEILSNSIEYCKHYLGDYKHNANIHNKYEAIILGGVRSRERCCDDSYYCRYTDPLREKLLEYNITSTMFEYNPVAEYRTPRHSSSYFIWPLLLKAKCITVMGRIAKTKYDVNIIRYNEFLEFLDNTLGGHFNLSKKNIVSKAIFIVACSHLFEKHIRRIGPIMSVVVCYYTSIGMAWCLACNRRNVPVVDLQHGVAGEFHRAYGHWHKVPDDGYDLMPVGFWCWDEDSAKGISEWNSIIDNHFEVVGGNLWARMWREGNHGIVKHSYSDDMKLSSYPSTSTIVLFSLSDEGEMSPLLLDIIKNSPSSFVWWLRVHPCAIARIAEIARHYEVYKNVEVKIASTVPLYAILKYCDVHVTEWSSVVLDAYASGVPSVIIHENGEELYSELIKQGRCDTAYTVEEAIERIGYSSSLKFEVCGRYFDQDTSVREFIDSLHH